MAQLLVDAHVHFYPCFDRDAFFTAAAENFRRSTVEIGPPGEGQGVLLLTETHEDHFFREWARDADRRVPGRWVFQKTAEDCSLVAHSTDGQQIVIIAGRQIPTIDGLEVLALGCERTFPTALSLPEALAAVRMADALPVIPWGFGKWSFRRGALVAREVRATRPGELFLGDNGGRLTPGLPPSLFRLAEAHGLSVLPGSDPLPFPDHATRAGSYGFAVEVEFDTRTAAGSLKGSLRRGAVVRSYGRRTPLIAFCRNQLRAQARKRHLRSR